LTRPRARVAFARVASPPERRVKLRLHYDGADFHGWQVQPGKRTVQGELEAALSRLTDRPAQVLGGGRTDRGVHATGQVASALVPDRWTAAALLRALNAVLPPDVWVAAAEEVALDFHARYDAVARAYVYRVGTGPGAFSPFRRRWCWPLWEPLDVTAMERSTAGLMGEHSFRSFSKSGQPERGERCTVLHAAWVDWPGRGLVFRITANRFLHHMVRYLVGTMVDVGRGRRPASDVGSLLAGATGVETSPPAPAHGLFLTGIYYTRSELDRAEATDEDLP
jgi:tRNA pseudouridine38-40 synthase